MVTALEGFFSPRPRVESALFPCFALVPPSWEALSRQLDAAPGAKLLLLLRHAQGAHNVAGDAFGAGFYHSELARAERFLDADLTPRGAAQCRDKGPAALRRELQRGMPPVGRVVVSPLSRSVQTAQSFFAREQLPPRPLLCLERCREVLDRCSFDRRRPLAELRRRFPDVDFSRVESEEDQLWSPTHYETRDEIHARARSFLEELFDAVPERHVVVVSHVVFMQAVYAVATGGELDRPENCDVVPLVLQAT